MSLNLKYRPKLMNKVIGNKPVKSSLVKKIRSGDIPHSFLFTGPSGCGKTTIGRILAIKLGALGKKENPNVSMDYNELDSVSYGGVDAVRDIRNHMHSSPIKGKAKVYLLDECHELTAKAQEGLLKALEEPPDHVYFVLCTTEPQKLKTTIKRRCAKYEMSPIDEEEMLDFLKSICKKEGKKVPQKAIERIIEISNGSVGEALMHLETIIDLDKKEMIKAAKNLKEKKKQAIELVRSLYGKCKWNAIAKILGELQGDDAERIRRLMMSWCRSILLKKKDDRAYLIFSAFQDPFYDNGYDDLLIACYEVVHGGE